MAINIDNEGTRQDNLYKAKLMSMQLIIACLQYQRYKKSQPGRISRYGIDSKHHKLTLLTFWSLIALSVCLILILLFQLPSHPKKLNYSSPLSAQFMSNNKKALFASSSFLCFFHSLSIHCDSCHLSKMITQSLLELYGWKLLGISACIIVCILLIFIQKKMSLENVTVVRLHW